jgi:hypothetical protein
MTTEKVTINGQEMNLRRPENHPRYCQISHISGTEVVHDFLSFALDYVGFRAFGHAPIVAWRKTFGVVYGGGLNEERIRSEMYEYNSTIQALYEMKLKEVSVDKLWTAKAAAHRLLSIAHDPESKCSTQVAAAKELNVMFGITIVDENGKTRAARTLEDFYKEAAGDPPKTDEPAKPQNDR